MVYEYSLLLFAFVWVGFDKNPTFSLIYYIAVPDVSRLKIQERPVL